MSSTEQPLLGNIVSEVVHGTEGLAVCHTEHWYGCSHIGIEPTKLLEGGGVAHPLVYDEQRVKFVRKGPKLSRRIIRPKTALGATVKHKLNGLEGIVVSRTTWINHGPTLDVEPMGRDARGELHKTVIFDEDMIEVIETKPPASTVKDSSRIPGGPGEARSWNRVRD